MTVDEIYNDIKELAGLLGVPEKDTAYDLGTAPNPPYLIWMLDEAVESFDNTAYARKMLVTLEYYSDFRNYEAEHKISDYLTDKGTSYDVEHERIDDEQMDMTRYEYEVNYNV